MNGNQRRNVTELIDLQEIKVLQDRFCSFANVFTFCVDAQGQWLTSLSGDAAEARRLEDLLTVRRLTQIARQVLGSTIEEQIVEDTPYSNIKLAAISVKIQNIPIIGFVVCAIIADSKDGDRVSLETEDFATITTESKFYKALDFLRIAAPKLLQVRYSLAEAKEESRKSKYSQQEMSAVLKRNEAFTGIVQLLESEAAIENIIEEILEIAGTFLQVSSAQVFRIQENGSKMDMIAEWCDELIIPYFQQIRNIPKSVLLNHVKAMIISTDTKVTLEEAQAMREARIAAAIILPITMNGEVSMYLCLNECQKDRVWVMEESKFAMDVAKMIQSILVRRFQKNSIAGSHALLESILDNIGSAVCVQNNENHKLLFVNSMFQQMFSDEIKRAEFESIFASKIKDITKSCSIDVCYEAQKGWFELRYAPITWVDGSESALYVISDITDKQLYQKKIEQQVYTDFLTGLSNRMCCERDLAIQIDNADRHGQAGALFYIDLDDFKHINDGLGHEYGDILLQNIAYSLREIKGVEDTCYRVGGDEFVVIVPPEYSGKTQLIAEEIRDIFSKPWYMKNTNYYCTMSMGIVNFPYEGEGVQDFIRKADIAMYEAKRSGKNQIVQYSHRITSESNKRLTMEKCMRNATTESFEEFEVYYQPIIDIQLEGTPCVGAEALIRWNSPELGFLGPSDFIPLAEYLGLINSIGNYVLQEACRACKHWNESGHPEFKVNVNLSVLQLLQKDIKEIIAKVLKETGIQTRNLTLEVTEGLAINDMGRMKSILGEIKKLGVRIALDDFGVGYSSLNHIREIPLDVIKVDQSFVLDLAEDSYSKSFIQMISELANSIGVSVCVEGIETKEQYQVLNGMNVRLIQGYYFDRPMPRLAFEIKYI